VYGNGWPIMTSRGSESGNIVAYQRQRSGGSSESSQYQ